MNVQIRRCAFAATLLAAVAPVFAQQNQKPDVLPQDASKEQLHERMRSLAQEIQKLRDGYGSPAQVELLTKEYDAISRSLGGDQPANQTAPGAQPFGAVSTGGTQQLIGPTCGSVTPLTVNFAGTTGPILPTPPMPVVYTAVVVGAGTFLWDLNLTTNITHTACGDLDITLKSPAGTIVTITTDNGGTLDDVFNGTAWDEQTLLATGTVADRGAEAPVFVNGVTMTPLTAEGRLTAFRGEDPNGIWTLSVTDDTSGNSGTVNFWSVDVTTLAAPPVDSTTRFSNITPLPILDVATQSSTILVSGMGTYMDNLVMGTQITHTYASDLDITLTSPLGTVVKVSTDNGGSFDNVFNGTLFSGASTNAITDYVFVNLVAAPGLCPEGSFDNFLGEDPNGTWTLTITDDLGADVGNMTRWDIFVTTTAPPTPAGPFSFSGTVGPIPDPGAGGPPTPTIFTAAVAGMGPYLWDVDLNTFITNTSAADLDMTLTSPAGTTVTISTDNGGTNDNVFNGTQWDDNVTDLVMSHVYTNGVTATPLTPEGRIAGFRGEDPNGIWTLTITDDATAADYGDVNGWSLDVSTLNSAPGEVATTISQSPGLFLADYSGGPTTTSDAMVFAGLPPFLTEVELYLEITHTFAGDLKLVLTSPLGTVVTLSDRNGGSFDNVYNGTLFDNNVTDTPTDHVYANLVAVPALSPQGPFDALLGQDPNGVWTLSSIDNAGIDTGTLVRWDLTIKTCLGNGSAFCSNGTLGVDHSTPCPCGNTGLAPNGCAHSFSADGANLSANGSSGADTVQLVSINEPNTAFTLFMQHTAPADVVFHDGVLCAGGTLLRLRGRGAVGGSASFPNPLWDSSITLSQRGSVIIGSGTVRYYGAWYRNASTTFCPPATANVSNGWVITW